MIPKIVRVSPLFFISWQILGILHGIAYGVIAPITQNFFDKATAFASHRTVLSEVITGLIVLGLAQVVKQALNGIVNFMVMIYYRKAEGVLSLEVHEKMSRLDPASFEDTQALDSINKAIQGKNEAMWFTGSILATFNFYIPYFLCMAVYLFSIRPILVVSLTLVFTPTLFTQILRTKVFSKAEDQSAPIRREFDYYENCIVSREYFKETRILGAFSFFRQLYADSLILLNRLRFRASVKSDMAELGMQIISLCGYVGILLLLLQSLMNRQIGVGAFAAIFGSVDQMFSLMKELICYNYGAVARDFGRVQNYLRFMEMPERDGANVDISDDADIILRNVSFTYPGVDQKAVDSVNLKIKNGETIAIVGENGSGKTTLVRLLIGIYLPTDGEVCHGGYNTKDISMTGLFGRISAVFQKYQRYQMNLRENIGISQVNISADEDTFDIICTQAGINKGDNSFPEGYDTMLSREFDGVDLSGGQWQRVAIARGYFRPHQVIVLDEPTAAIDPIEETKIYNRFAEISKERTAVIVTHRLGSVKLADRILVMKNGRLVEQGTHDELITIGGEYARLYTSQEQWYKS